MSFPAAGIASLKAPSPVKMTSDDRSNRFEFSVQLKSCVVHSSSASSDDAALAALRQYGLTDDELHRQCGRILDDTGVGAFLITVTKPAEVDSKAKGSKLPFDLKAQREATSPGMTK